MPRVIVTTDPPHRAGHRDGVLLDEHVHSVHLSSGHAAAQLVERIAWAISDAEDTQAAAPARRPSSAGKRSRGARRLRAQAS